MLGRRVVHTASQRRATLEHMSPAGRAAAERALRRQAQSPDATCGAEDFRAAGEDDDGYDPYCDYMDSLARDASEGPEADPWR